MSSFWPEKIVRISGIPESSLELHTKFIWESITEGIDFISIISGMHVRIFRFAKCQNCSFVHVSRAQKCISSIGVVCGFVAERRARKKHITSSFGSKTQPAFRKSSDPVRSCRARLFEKHNMQAETFVMWLLRLANRWLAGEGAHFAALIWCSYLPGKLFSNKFLFHIGSSSFLSAPTTFRCTTIILASPIQTKKKKYGLHHQRNRKSCMLSQCCSKCWGPVAFRNEIFHFHF
jgi:hypothetical protein